MIVPNKVCKRDSKDVTRPAIIERITEEAQYYYEAAQVLERNRKEDELFPPVIMNAVFACELFSKAILYKEQETGLITGHSLKKFYKLFSENTKNQIKQLSPNISEERLEKFIDDIDELFEFWRYRYEYSSYNTHYSFVLEYMEILKNVTDTMIMCL